MGQGLHVREERAQRGLHLGRGRLAQLQLTFEVLQNWREGRKRNCMRHGVQSGFTTCVRNTEFIVNLRSCIALVLFLGFAREEISFVSAIVKQHERFMKRM